MLLIQSCLDRRSRVQPRSPRPSSRPAAFCEAAGPAAGFVSTLIRIFWRFSRVSSSQQQKPSTRRANGHPILSRSTRKSYCERRAGLCGMKGPRRPGPARERDKHARQRGCRAVGFHRRLISTRLPLLWATRRKAGKAGENCVMSPVVEKALVSMISASLWVPGLVSLHLRSVQERW